MARMAARSLMVGTRKGLWIGTSDEAREDWEFTGPHFDMEEVYSCMVDTRGDTAAAAGRRVVELARARRSGAPTTSARPGRRRPTAPIRFPEGTDATVARVWQLVPGAEDGVVYAGTEPGAVWRSTDRGETFALEQALWDHPHRPEWGAGFGGQAFHTILPHPTDPQSVTAAISTGGVYQTTDGGASWQPRNQGIRAEFLPEGEQYPEFGQCVHKVTRHPARPERLYLQNHGGVYRSDDEGGVWKSIADGLPADFGFPIVVHPHEPDTVYVFPLNGGAGRYPPDGKARVWRSRDAGETWEELGDGLPDAFYVGVMRDAMCADDHDERRHLLRRPQRRGVGLGRLRRHLAADRRRPARRDGGPGRRAVRQVRPWEGRSRVTRSDHVSPPIPAGRPRPGRRLPRVDRSGRRGRTSTPTCSGPTPAPTAASARTTPGRATARPARAAWRSPARPRTRSTSTCGSSSRGRPEQHGQSGDRGSDDSAATIRRPSSSARWTDVHGRMARAVFVAIGRRRAGARRLGRQGPRRHDARQGRRARALSRVMAGRPRLTGRRPRTAAARHAAPCLVRSRRRRRRSRQVSRRPRRADLALALAPAYR